MSLASRLPHRPLTFDEAGTIASFEDVELVAPMFASHGLSRANDEELIIACVLAHGDRGELAGFDPSAAEWTAVAVFPDITDLSGLFASLDVLNAWVFDRYDRGTLVRIHLTIDLEG